MRLYKILVLLLLSCSTYAQWSPAVNNYQRIKGVWPFERLKLPSDTSVTKEVNTLVAVGNKLWLSNGTYYLDVTGAGGLGGVASFNTRTGAVSLIANDVNVALGFIPISPSDTASMLLAYVKLSRFVDSCAALRSAINAVGVPPVSSVFGRTGTVTAQAGDYSIYYPSISRLLDSTAAVWSRVQAGYQPAGNYLVAGNNLADVSNVATARTNLNVYSKTEADARFLQSFTESDPVWTAAAANYYTKTQADARYLQSFTETDPTVYAWAKAATKPSYAVAEITGLQTALDGKEPVLGFTPVPNTRTINGYALSANISLTKTDVGLGNVPNTDATNPANISQSASYRFVTDSEKSTWNAKQNSLGYTAENLSNKGVANGYAALGSDSKILAYQLPQVAINQTFTVNSQSAMLALSANQGDIAVRTDQNKAYILAFTGASTLANWIALPGVSNEADPVFTGSPAFGITGTNISNWNSAFGWGNHAGLYRPVSWVPSWTDVTGRPTALSQFTNDAGFITGINSSMVTGALGYTPFSVGGGTMSGHINMGLWNLSNATTIGGVNGELTGRLFIQNSNSTYSVPSTTDVPNIYIRNGNNASTNAHAILTLRTNNTGGGNPFISFDIENVTGWSMGVDNADGDKFKIASSWAGVAYATRMTLDASGNVNYTGVATSNGVSSIDRIRANTNNTNGTATIGTYWNNSSIAQFVNNGLVNHGGYYGFMQRNDGATFIGTTALEINNNTTIIGTLGSGAITSTGQLSISNTASSVSAFFLRSNIDGTTIPNTGLILGKAASTRNSASIVYNHVSDGSTSNRIGFGFWGADDLFVLRANGKIGVNNNAPKGMLDINHGMSNPVGSQDIDIDAVRLTSGGVGISAFRTTQFDAVNQPASGDIQFLNLFFNGSTYNWYERMRIRANGEILAPAGSIKVTNGGVDGSYQDAFVAQYNANNNETNAIQTAVSGDGSLSGFRFMASNGAGSTGRTNVLTLTRNTSTLNGEGVANSPTLRINTSTTTTFIHTQENFAQNATAGQSIMMFVGKEGSTKNTANIGYYWAAAGSNDNFVSIGHWGADHLLRVYGNGNVTAAGTMSATRFFATSDIRLKTVFSEFKSADGINTILYSFKNEFSPAWGYNAQQVQKEMSFAVTEGNDGYLRVDYQQVHTYKIMQLEKRIAELERRVNNGLPEKFPFVDGDSKKVLLKNDHQ